MYESVEFQLDRALDDPKNIIKKTRDTLETAISIHLIPANDSEFLENIAKIRDKLLKFEKISKSK